MKVVPPDLRPWFLTLDDIDNDYDGKLDWPAFFGNDNPVQIDVGCGRGLFTLTAAEGDPAMNTLGIEVDFKEGRRGARRLMKRELPNARVLGGDVKRAFTRMIEPHSVDAVHVYFPDPWWKARHRRRRVFNEEFTHLAARILKPGGLLHSWTDVEEYFEVITSLMDHHELFEKLPPPEERAPEHDMDYQTSFERKKRQLGLPIYRGRWRRVEL